MKKTNFELNQIGNMDEVSVRFYLPFSYYFLLIFPVEIGEGRMFTWQQIWYYCMYFLILVRNLYKYNFLCASSVYMHADKNTIQWECCKCSAHSRNHSPKPADVWLLDVLRTF